MISSDLYGNRLVRQYGDQACSKSKKNLFHLKKAKVELINFKRKDNVFRQDIFRQKKLSSS